MMESDIDVVVSAPEERIVASGGRVSLQHIFLQRLFEVSVNLDGRKVSFEVNLPEWLEALSKFLREKGVSVVQAQLILSGDRFEAQRFDDGMQIRVFDRMRGQCTWLMLTHPQVKQLHAKLLAELCAAVDRSAGHHMEILDLDRVSVS